MPQSVGMGRKMGHEAKIRRLLADRNWSVSRLAKEMDAPQTTVDRLVKRLPESVLMAIQMARVLGVPAEWLYDDELDWPPVKATRIDTSLPKEIQQLVAQLLAKAAQSIGGSEPPYGPPPDKSGPQ
jgi:transcriptional regulator with XRE-family HTH domain